MSDATGRSYRLKEKDVAALLVGSDQKFPLDWKVRFTIGAGGALGFIQDGETELFWVEPGWWVVRDLLTDRLYRMEPALFDWLKEEVNVH